MISRGGGPRTLCDVTCGDKQMGEVKRVLAWRHKSAEPIEAERAGTSGPVSGLACEPAKVKETESMVDAPLEHGTCQLGSRRDNPLWKQGVGGVLVCTGDLQTGGLWSFAGRPMDIFALSLGPIPHGVKSAPKAGQRSYSEPKNLVMASLPVFAGMMEATHERCDEGRSLRSSPRTGKPFTRSILRIRRREAVDTDCKQEVGLCPAR